MTTTDQDVEQVTQLLTYVVAMTNGDFRRATLLLYTAESSAAIWTVRTAPLNEVQTQLEQLTRDCIAFRAAVLDHMQRTPVIPTAVNPDRPF